MPSISSINPDEKTAIRKVIKTPKNQIITATVVRLYVAHPNPDEWTYSNLMGAVAFVKDQEKNSFFFRLVDLMNGHGILWEQELYKDFQYNEERPFFHTFCTDDYYAAFSFASETEAKNFCKKVINREKLADKAKKNQKNSKSGGIFSNNKKKNKIDKATISQPSDFRHLGHIGFNPDTGYDVQNIDPSWRGLFEQLSEMGVSQELIRQNADYIVRYVEENGGIKPNKPVKAITGKSASGAAKRTPPPPPIRRPGSSPSVKAKAKSPPPPPPVRRSVFSNQSNNNGSLSPPLSPKQIIHPPSPKQSTLKQVTSHPPPPPPLNKTAPPPPPPISSVNKPVHPLPAFSVNKPVQPPVSNKPTQPPPVSSAYKTVHSPQVQIAPPPPPPPVRPSTTQNEPPPLPPARVQTRVPPRRPTSAAVPPPPPPPPHSSGSAPPPPPPPPPISRGVPPPPPPPTSNGAPPPPPIPPPVSNSTSLPPVSNGRANLLAEIRNVGGASKAGLRSVGEPTRQSTISEEPQSPTGGNDLASALASALLNRGAAIRGDSDEDDDDDDDDWDD